MATRHLLLPLSSLALTGLTLIGAQSPAMAADPAPVQQPASPAWAGTWTEHKEERGADDGTSTVTVVISADAKGWEVRYEEVSMTVVAWRGRGTVVGDRLEVNFEAPISSNLNPEAFKKGRLIFTLRPVPGDANLLQSAWPMSNGVVDGAQLRRAAPR